MEVLVEAFGSVIWWITLTGGTIGLCFFVLYLIVIYWDILETGIQARRELAKGSVLDPDNHEWYHTTDEGEARLKEILRGRNELEFSKILDDGVKRHYRI